MQRDTEAGPIRNCFAVSRILNPSSSRVDIAKRHYFDEHYFRQLTFRDEGNYGRYYSVLVDIGYYLTSCAKVFTALSWNKYGLC
ncbi:omptin family outer membrane protease [Symbiopectobacterium sp. RP]|uniref:omptin family outer membrane protease n=1 Tax=Symbiopectobacterium sp. RP TaxID=3248553 RepID=UPI003D2D9A19